MGGYFPFLVKFEAKNDHYQFIFQIKSFIFNIGYGNVKLLGGDRLFPIWNRPILNRQEGVNSIADNFGMCNWRPDSETVASRAFAQTSPITGFLRLALCQYDRVN